MKTDNSNLAAKLELRRHVLRKSGLKWFSVLDCFSGSEVLWSRLRREFRVERYLALDLKPKRGRLQMDCLRFLQNDLGHMVIDLDCYGEPWKYWFEVLARIKESVERPEKHICFLTVGVVHFDSFASIWRGALREAGIEFDIPIGIQSKLHEFVFDVCLTSRVAPLRIAYAAEAVLASPGNARYLGLILDGKGGA